MNYHKNMSVDLHNYSNLIYFTFVLPTVLIGVAVFLYTKLYSNHLSVVQRFRNRKNLNN